MVPSTEESTSQVENKETKEGLIAGNEIGVFIAARLKDGPDVGDALALIKKLQEEPEFLAVVQAGIDKAGQIPGEIKAMGFGGYAELVTIQISYIPKYLQALS